MSKGVRLNPKHDERTRAKIKTSQIINRLIKHVNGEAEMTNTQIRAAEILLKKTLPDLSASHVAYHDHTTPKEDGVGIVFKDVYEASRIYKSVIEADKSDMEL